MEALCFLMKLGELPLEAQARLLRVLQEARLDVLDQFAQKKVSVRLHRCNTQELERTYPARRVS